MFKVVVLTITIRLNVTSPSSECLQLVSLLKFLPSNTGGSTTLPDDDDGDGDEDEDDSDGTWLTDPLRTGRSPLPTDE